MAHQDSIESDLDLTEDSSTTTSSSGGSGNSKKSKRNKVSDDYDEIELKPIRVQSQDVRPTAVDDPEIIEMVCAVSCFKSHFYYHGFLNSRCACYFFLSLYSSRTSARARPTSARSNSASGTSCKSSSSQVCNSPPHCRTLPYMLLCLLAPQATSTVTFTITSTTEMMSQDILEQYIARLQLDRTNGRIDVDTFAKFVGMLDSVLLDDGGNVLGPDDEGAVDLDAYDLEDEDDE